MPNVHSLGLVPVADGTFEHDIAVLGRYQDFSAELLRLALLGISAIGVFASRVLLPAKGGGMLHVSPPLRVMLVVAIAAFGASAASALIHRYVSTDSVSWHLQAMRRYQRGEGNDIHQADSESRQRLRRFKISQQALAMASFSLGLGAIALGCSVAIAL